MTTIGRTRLRCFGLLAAPWEEDEDDRRFLEALHLADHRPEGSPGDGSRGREGGVCARRLLVRRSLYGGCRVKWAIEQVGKAASGRLSFLARSAAEILLRFPSVFLT